MPRLQAVVDDLTDPVDETFVREFQMSTIAAPVPEPFLEAVIANSRRMPARVWKAVIQGLIEFESTLCGPRFARWCSADAQDAVFSATEQMVLARQFPRGELHLVDGVGHTLHWEQPATFVSALIRFGAVNPVAFAYARCLINVAMATTAAAVARALADRGIERAFGLPGGEVLVLIDELRKVGIDFVLMRHEANAGIAAAVYGKLQRQPGVVIATLGPGAANLLLPVANAYLDQEPLLAITAQIPDDFPPSHTHQLLPLHDTYRPMCKVVEKVTCTNARRHHSARARLVHGASLRCVVRDAVGTGGGQTGDGGHAVSQRAWSRHRRFTAPTRERRHWRSRRNCRKPNGRSCSSD